MQACSASAKWVTYRIYCSVFSLYFESPTTSKSRLFIDCVSTDHIYQHHLVVVFVVVVVIELNVVIVVIDNTEQESCDRRE